MKGAATILSIFLLSLPGGCHQVRHGLATLRGTAPHSAIDGTAVFTQTETGVKARVKLEGAPPGVHGIHIHEHGNCGDMGKTAGGHFNPAGVKHGFLPKDGMAGAHAGDMGNITIRADGSGVLNLELPGLTLDQGPHGIIGRSVILHEKVDDFGQPTGNAGGRIACGVIEEPGR